ncbi:MAG: DUF5668 domain-containing protein [Bacteroidota bacterium]|nr:DUF5668 domain-containing protein [Bacteroidota bacterium]MDP4233591.1 DUF5668 domain-containing protein [Bacteroidota bacterium]MDP4243635.1 DUF5668 domain-containing protein [Bacteroidota bacterium]MDP4287778.1 DUF5668 domain-containing protein [Bacteroidota bacterium]
MEQTRSAVAPLIYGLVLATIGVVFLLDRFSMVNADVVWQAWPLVFCVWGIVRLFSSPEPREKIIALFAIGMGVLLTMHEFGAIRYGIGDLWPLFLIVPGLLMVWRALQTRKGAQVDVVPSLDRSGFNSVAIFGGIDRRVEGEFKSGVTVTAVFGGFKIDLSRAQMKGDDAVIFVNAFFGGGEIYTPESWHISMEGIGLFGGFSDKTRYTPTPGAPTKTLHVRGSAIFGGVEVKN